ncbi:MAG: hypothetical protein EXR93_12305, partial [Gemmatimonadetes bacterium]|nr:hypothetical protein [Gemmatimonadota bacterium]
MQRIRSERIFSNVVAADRVLYHKSNSMKKISEPRTKISPGLAGTAGEYLVAGELSRRGYIASLTLRNARGIDVLVSDEDARR